MPRILSRVMIAAGEQSRYNLSRPAKTADVKSFLRDLWGFFCTAHRVRNCSHLASSNSFFQRYLILFLSRLSLFNPNVILLIARVVWELFNLLIGLKRPRDLKNCWPLHHLFTTSSGWFLVKVGSQVKRESNSGWNASSYQSREK